MLGEYGRRKNEAGSQDGYRPAHWPLVLPFHSRSQVAVSVSEPRTWMFVRRNAKSGAGSFTPQPAGTPTPGPGPSQARHGAAPHVPWGPCQADHTMLVPGPPVRPHRRRPSETWTQGACSTHRGELGGPGAAHGAWAGTLTGEGRASFSTAAGCGAPPRRPGGGAAGGPLSPRTPDLWKSVLPPAPPPRCIKNRPHTVPFSPRSRNRQWRPCSIYQISHT